MKQKSSYRFAHEAMATTFGIIIAGETEEYSRQASQAVFGEIDRLEGLLSRFTQSSDVSRINKLGYEEPVRVNIDTFECLQKSLEIYDETGGVFDITVGKLADHFKYNKNLSNDELELIKSNLGMENIELDNDNFTVKLKNNFISIDLGGIGKGFALDKGAEILEDWSIESVFIHGGESSVLAIGSQPGKDGWIVNISEGMGDKGREVSLKNRSLSSSGTRVKGQHIVNPKTGLNAEGAVRTWVSCPSAADSDALSTAFMVMSIEDIEEYCFINNIWSNILMNDNIFVFGEMNN